VRPVTESAAPRPYNNVARYQNYLLADKDKIEALRRLYEIAARTGEYPRP
jgi:hypothetical protein